MEIKRDDKGRVTSVEGGFFDRMEDEGDSIHVRSILTGRETVVVKSKAPDVYIENS